MEQISNTVTRVHRYLILPAAGYGGKSTRLRDLSSRKQQQKRPWQSFSAQSWPVLKMQTTFNVSRPTDHFQQHLWLPCLSMPSQQLSRSEATTSIHASSLLLEAFIALLPLYLSFHFQHDICPLIHRFLNSFCISHEKMISTLIKRNWWRLLKIERQLNDQA